MTLLTRINLFFYLNIFIFIQSSPYQFQISYNERKTPTSLQVKKNQNFLIKKTSCNKP